MLRAFQEHEPRTDAYRPALKIRNSGHLGPTMDIQNAKSLSKTDLLKIGLKLTGETVISRGRNFIYLPRRYDSNPEYEQWKSSLEAISYEVSGLKMRAFLDSDPESPPERIWFLFGGNASLALDWLPVTSFAPPSADAFVLFDYPGYGECEGAPSRRLINSCIDQLIVEVMAKFSIDPAESGDRFLVKGHSLGCAVALETASRYGIKRGLLVSPFTSIREMAQQMFWKPLSYFAADPYDSVETLQKISELVTEAEFHIVHGTNDSIIPIRMAKDLHAAAPRITRFWEIEDADHNDILLLLSRELGTALTNGGAFSYGPEKQAE